MAKTPKQLDKSKIIEAISLLPLNEILEVNYKTAEIIEEKENDAKKRKEDADKDLEMIRLGNGGNK